MAKSQDGTKREELNLLTHNYFLPDYDPAFAKGRRSDLLYAVKNTVVQLAKVNPRGPEPIEYINFAKADLAAGGARGPINALGNAKRAVHLSIETFLRVYSLKKVSARRPFPQVVEILDTLGVFPTRLVRSLNQRRNLMEHEYEHPAATDVLAFLEVAELFVTLSYIYFRQAVVGVYLGRQKTNKCEQHLLDHASNSLKIFEVEAPAMINTPNGAIHYNIGKDDPRTERESIAIERGNQDDWISSIDLFVYCTRREFFELHGLGPPGVIYPTKIHFEVTEEKDEIGRQLVKSVQTTEVPEGIVKYDMAKGGDGSARNKPPKRTPVSS